MTLTRLRYLVLAFILLGAVAILCAWTDSMRWQSSLFIPLGGDNSLMAFQSGGRLLLGFSLIRQHLDFGIHLGFHRSPVVEPGPALFQAVRLRHDASAGSDYWAAVLPSWLLLAVWLLGGLALFYWLGRREARRKKLTSP